MQFLDLIENPDPATRAKAPLLMVFQTGQAKQLATVLQVPCRPAGSSPDLGPLTPLIDTPLGRMRAMVPEMAAVPRRAYPSVVGSASADRDAFVHALDLLVTGV